MAASLVPSGSAYALHATLDLSNASTDPEHAYNRARNEPVNTCSTEEFTTLATQEAKGTSLAQRMDTHEYDNPMIQFHNDLGVIIQHRPALEAIKNMGRGLSVATAALGMPPPGIDASTEEGRVYLEHWQRVQDYFKHAESLIMEGLIYMEAPVINRNGAPMQ